MINLNTNYIQNYWIKSDIQNCCLDNETSINEIVVNEIIINEPIHEILNDSINKPIEEISNEKLNKKIINIKNIIDNDNQKEGYQEIHKFNRRNKKHTNKQRDQYRNSR